MGPLAFIGLALSAIGSGLQYSASMSAARTQETFSLLNAQAGMQQATQQANMASLQAQLQSAQAQTQQAAAQDNAEAMRQQTDAETAAAEENIRRQRDEFSRGLAAEIAQSSGSSVTFGKGSLFDLLNNASDAAEQGVQDQQGIIQNQAYRGYRQAAATALGGRVEGLNASLYQLDAMAALQEGRMRSVQAQLGGMAGQAQAQGMRSQAFGSLISQGGSLALQGATLWKNRATTVPRTAGSPWTANYWDGTYQA
jgi:hypothetical protein